MDSVNIVLGWKGKDASALKRFFSDELQKNGLKVVRSSSYFGLRKSDVVLLFYDVKRGACPEFEKRSKRLIRMNIRPIIIVCGIQEDTDPDDIGNDIYGCWNELDSRVKKFCAHFYFYDNEKKCIYIFSPDESKGLFCLVNFVHALKCKMLFRDEDSSDTK